MRDVWRLNISATYTGTRANFLQGPGLQVLDLLNLDEGLKTYKFQLTDEEYRAQIT